MKKTDECGYGTDGRTRRIPAMEADYNAGGGFTNAA
jgi:hypothetical protein